MFRDRNFCTRQFLSGIAQKSSYFIIRQHKSLSVEEISTHGVGKVEAGLSDYYLVEEVQATYRCMASTLSTPLWLPITQMSLSEFARILKQWATWVNLKRFCSSLRSHKKPKPTYEPKHPRRSTARLLQQHKQYKRSL
ncbi:MAG: hypothetical protein ACFCAD_21400 [Pleurocapsa sp.]